MNASSAPMSSRANGQDLLWNEARPAGHSSIMRRYPSPWGPVSSSFASGVTMMPGLIVLIRPPHLLTRGPQPSRAGERWAPTRAGQRVRVTQSYRLETSATNDSGLIGEHRRLYSPCVRSSATLGTRFGLAALGRGSQTGSASDPPPGRSRRGCRLASGTRTEPGTVQTGGRATDRLRAEARAMRLTCGMRPGFCTRAGAFGACPGERPYSGRDQAGKGTPSPRQGSRSAGSCSRIIVSVAVISLGWMLPGPER
jgi:hypothetical protein